MDWEQWGRDARELHGIPEDYEPKAKVVIYNMNHPVGTWYERVKDIITPAEGIELEKNIPHILPSDAHMIAMAYLLGKTLALQGKTLLVPVDESEDTY